MLTFGIYSVTFYYKSDRVNESLIRSKCGYSEAPALPLMLEGRNSDAALMEGTMAAMNATDFIIDYYLLGRGKMISHVSPPLFRYWKATIRFENGSGFADRLAVGVVFVHTTTFHRIP
eukprot:scaffold2179_cov165-Amphora_coffeaeformis.AAC.4